LEKFFVFNGIASQESGTLWSFKRRCLHIIFLALQPRSSIEVIHCKSAIWDKTVRLHTQSNIVMVQQYTLLF
jgi:hypothetical protein